VDEKDPAWQELDVSAIAALRDGSGKTFGQMILGKPNSKTSFSRRDLVEIEAIINLVAVIINSKRGKGK
jgi:hypothetical protein